MAMETVTIQVASAEDFRRQQARARGAVGQQPMRSRPLALRAPSRPMRLLATLLRPLVRFALREELMTLSARIDHLTVEIAHMKPKPRIPKDEWHIERCGADAIAAGIYEYMGALWWEKIPLADLPNDLIGAEDLKRLGIDLPQHAAIVQPELGQP